MLTNSAKIPATRSKDETRNENATAASSRAVRDVYPYPLVVTT
jgi:hypothetical protein